MTETLERLGIPYMVTGSIASSLFGEPRSTHDIDLVVDIPVSTTQQLLDEFRNPRYFLQDRVAVEAIRQRRMFTLYDQETGFKVDFWPVGASSFDQLRFSRRRQIDDGNGRLWFSTPEDTILKKLCWSIDSGGSEKQFRDVLRVYELQFARLDMTYLETWARDLKVTDLWDRLKKEAVPLT
ncbi:MAG TPA: hypothetical protein VM510_06305 [Caulifigura sp.]|nr:hypothetical protein [Caulifigura sp.]